ncbi:aspartyl/asparaginyl beta-hydroxylase domain-containing protein [Micromonospora endolithica]|uniref:Aspartyl beta-hydroxylase n=1 Tax=Micromonospora endolithica TaxID=230091 RepID=A0A3A9ZIH6_9ACTN|nr:aspartyl/asparaginyl beta-hydroxylase domain-containing protein [Micromonospora endolithica]RKN48222.1 aspartyl beta-hydroxylase [Micromonospora endolithica]TWJ24739.1 aspartyl/asparaginyl beta-hydroxylase [Micromonospora endolithica]
MTVTALATSATLPTEVAALRPIDSGLMERLRHEALTVPSDWVVEYGDYQNGGWHTLSLLNDTGDAQDVTIRDCPNPIATSLLTDMPGVRDLLAELGLRCMWARLARLGAGAFLWEHRDYGELADAERHRVHVPLVTNSSAYLILGGTKVHMSDGRVWRLTPTSPHGVCNRFGPDRIHLIIDCYADAAFDALNASVDTVADAVTMLPAPDVQELEEHVATATGLAELGYDGAAETTLLELFYRYALAEGQVYDLITAMYTALHRAEDAERWRVKKATMLGHS